MTHIVTVTLTDGQWAALSLDIVDPEEWIKNAATEKARTVVANLPFEIQMQAIAHVATNGGNPTDYDAIIIAAYDLGLVKTAEQRNTENQTREE